MKKAEAVRTILSAFYSVSPVRESETTFSFYMTLRTPRGRHVEIRLSDHPKPGWCRQVGRSFLWRRPIEQIVAKVHRLVVLEDGK